MMHFVSKPGYLPSAEDAEKEAHVFRPPHLAKKNQINKDENIVTLDVTLKCKSCQKTKQKKQ